MSTIQRRLWEQNINRRYDAVYKREILNEAGPDWKGGKTSKELVKNAKSLESEIRAAVKTVSYPKYLNRALDGMKSAISNLEEHISSGSGE